MLLGKVQGNAVYKERLEQRPDLKREKKKEKKKHKQKLLQTYAAEKHGLLMCTHYIWKFKCTNTMKPNLIQVWASKT